MFSTPPHPVLFTLSLLLWLDLQFTSQKSFFPVQYGLRHLSRSFFSGWLLGNLSRFVPVITAHTKVTLPIPGLGRTSNNSFVISLSVVFFIYIYWENSWEQRFFSPTNHFTKLFPTTNIRSPLFTSSLSFEIRRFLLGYLSLFTITSFLYLLSMILLHKKLHSFLL